MGSVSVKTTVTVSRPKKSGNIYNNLPEDQGFGRVMGER